MQQKDEQLNEELLNDAYLSVKREQVETNKGFNNEYDAFINSMKTDLSFINHSRKEIQLRLKKCEKLLDNSNEELEISSSHLKK